MIDRTKDFCFQLIGNAVVFFKRHLFSPGPSGKSANHRLNPTLSCIDPLALGRRLKANVYHIFHGPEPEETQENQIFESQRRSCNKHNPCANRTSHPITLWVSRACPESKFYQSLPVFLFFLPSPASLAQQKQKSIHPTHVMVTNSCWWMCCTSQTPQTPQTLTLQSPEARNSSQGLTLPFRNNLDSCDIKGVAKSGCHLLYVTFCDIPVVPAG